MERQLPRNVRQIGNVSDTPKIYVEDYVDTFFTQLCEKAQQEPMGAFLVGEMQKIDGEEYVFIHGAIQMHDLKMSGKDFQIDDAAWKNGYEDCKQYFEDGEIVGWFIARPENALALEGNMLKLHRKSFGKKNSVLILKDSVEKEEAYFVHKFNDLLEIGGHFTYYEKNPSMQNYMISSRKRNGVCPSETIEDRAAKDFRSLVRSREEQQNQRRAARMMYMVSTFLVLVVLAMGIAMLNNFDKMKSVETALQNMTQNTETNQNLDVQQSEDTGEDAVKEVSAPVIAADSEQEADVPNETIMQEDAKQQIITDGVYVVEEGDTLAIISMKAYGDISHVDAICRMNGLSDGNFIYIGQKLVLP